jgi:hypothetical protein
MDEARRAEDRISLLVSLYDLGDAEFEEAQAWGGSVGSRRAVECALR